jgi:YHS domain-containing protein
MWRILAPIIILTIVYWVIKKTLFPKKKNPRNITREGEELVQDPICKCYVPQTQAYAIDFKGKKLFFCSRECQKKFLAEKALPKS